MIGKLGHDATAVCQVWWLSEMLVIRAAAAAAWSQSHMTPGTEAQILLTGPTQGFNTACEQALKSKARWPCEMCPAA